MGRRWIHQCKRPPYFILVVYYRFWVHRCCRRRSGYLLVAWISSWLAHRPTLQSTPDALKRAGHFERLRLEMQNLEEPPPHRFPLRWKLLTLFFIVSGIGSLLAWAVLLTSFCSHPRIPAQAIAHSLTYHCHGKIVSISSLESALRHWLLPLGFVLVFLGLVAGFKGLIAAGIIRLNLSVQITDRSSKEGPP